MRLMIFMSLVKHSTRCWSSWPTSCHDQIDAPSTAFCISPSVSRWYRDRPVAIGVRRVAVAACIGDRSSSGTAHAGPEAEDIDGEARASAAEPATRSARKPKAQPKEAPKPRSLSQRRPRRFSSSSARCPSGHRPRRPSSSRNRAPSSGRNPVRSRACRRDPKPHHRRAAWPA